MRESEREKGYREVKRVRESMEGGKERGSV